MEWRCANCGRPQPTEDPPCEGCGHDEFEPAVVRLRWECTACGTRNAERDSPCRDCGLSEYVEVEPDDAAAGEPPAAGAAGAPDEDAADAPAYTEWQCTECGTGHPRNTPPCRRCGNMQFERVAVESGDVSDYVPTTGWLDVERRYLAGIFLVVAVVALAGLGVVPVPGDGLSGGVDVDTGAVATEVHDAIADERRAVGNDPTTRDPDLAAVAVAHARALGDEGRLSTAPGGETFAGRVAGADVDCGSPVTAVAAVRDPADFDGPSDVARGLVDHWLEDSDHRRRLLGPNVERSGVGVVLDDGRLWVTWVGC